MIGEQNISKTFKEEIFLNILKEETRRKKRKLKNKFVAVGCLLVFYVTI